MSIGELTSANFPRYSTRVLRKRLQLRVERNYKIARRNTKKAVRTFLTWQRSQYYLTTALQDVRQAARRNEDIFLASGYMSLTIVFAFGVTVGQIVLQSFLTMSYLNDITGISVLLLACMFAGVLTTLAAWLSALICNTLSLSVMDGATRKRIKSLRTTFRRGLRLATRTTTAWIAFLALLCSPLAFAGALGLSWVSMFSAGTMTDYFNAGSLCGAVGVLWLLYASTTFGLLPQVMLFEPRLDLFEALERSHNLVVRRGRPFLLALYLSAATLIAAFYGISVVLGKLIDGMSDLVFYGGIFVTVILVNLVLTALYRKRKLARVN